MKLHLLPQDPFWWIWLTTACLLTVGLAGYPAAFVVAIGLALAQTVWFAGTERALSAHGVQIRLAYTLLLLASYPPGWRWVNALPALGTFALVLVGYCPLARLLSLMPWNRTEPLTVDLVRRTFLTPPVIQRFPSAAAAAAGCPGGVCALEARVAEFTRGGASVPVRGFSGQGR